MDERRLRLFVAVAIPRRDLEALERALAETKRAVPGARWIALENQHVTLKFLGATDPGALEAVREACSSAAARCPPGQIALSGTGAFPSARRANVLWVGLDDPEGTLTGAASALDEVFEPLGWSPEKRAFKPHLTVARFKVPARLPALPDVRPRARPFVVGELGLYRSHLHPKGARYELLESFPLGARA